VAPLGRLLRAVPPPGDSVRGVSPGRGGVSEQDPVLKTQIVPRGGIFFGGSLPFAEVGAARYLRGAEVHCRVLL